GKSFTIAGLIAQVQRPTLILAPNKSLAAQLASEFREFFPKNRVEYFVSYYDYYQPEAYLPSSDTYIEKDSSINDEIDRLRHSATSALLSRRDVIIIASVSAIYGLGSPETYATQLLTLNVGEEHDQREILKRLVELQYERNDMAFVRNKFRVRGDTVEIFPAYEERGIRVQLFGDEIERIMSVDPVTGEMVEDLETLVLFPASHYVTQEEQLKRAVESIEAELIERLKWLEDRGKLLEAQRLRMRTTYDLEMMREIGFCSGIENYSRHLDGREAGEAPYTLLDYFPDDYLVVLDESHVTVPQLHGQYEGDRSRKDTLVEHGFRLPSAMDNRPLRFEEFVEKINQVVFMSATPGPYELEVSSKVVEQVVRPTGLMDPEVIVRPTKGQIDDLVAEINLRVERDQRVLVTTLTKKMSEDLTDYLLELGIRVRYLHSEVDTLERVEILRALRLGEFDVLVGINLLREGLDLPEVSFVAILDADKEGFLRSSTSLIQTMGRAARNIDGQVVMYADRVTDSMRHAISETNRRRKRQLEYNEEHGIDPKTIIKKVTDILEMVRLRDSDDTAGVGSGGGARGRGRSRRSSALFADLAGVPPDELGRLIQSLQEEMHEAAKELRFEEAARMRDEINELKRELKAVS
ncbi:MAG: excinuclease ABC subunit UvrB, partial [Acidimicrobiia bacterium]